MNTIKIDTHSMENQIISMKEQFERLKHRGEIVSAIPEINEMNPTVFLDQSSPQDNWGPSWCVTFQFDKCYACVYDMCRIKFVHFDDGYMNGRKEDFVTYYDDDQLVEQFKKHVDFLK